MQTTMALEDIKVTLPELLDSLTPGHELILTRNHQPVAKLVINLRPAGNVPRPGPGLCKGMINMVLLAYGDGRVRTTLRHLVTYLPWV